MRAHEILARLETRLSKPGAPSARDILGEEEKKNESRSAFFEAPAAWIWLEEIERLT